MNRQQTLINTFQKAASTGRLHHVRELLQCADLDPSANDSFALRAAAHEAHIAVVKCLLDDKRVKVSTPFDTTVLCSAIQFGHIDVFKLFLDDGRIDPSRHDNYVIRCAAKFNRLEMVDLLLKDARVHGPVVEKQVLELAARHGYLGIVDRLLQDERIDPAAEQNCAINQAANMQHFAVVDRLLLDNRIDSMSGDMPCFTDIRMIRSRMSHACVALQDLCIPALVLLEILDALLPNDIPMHKKWRVIVAVKHFVRVVE